MERMWILTLMRRKRVMKHAIASVRNCYIRRPSMTRWEEDLSAARKCDITDKFYVQFQTVNLILLNS